jgi:hypothetical protein
MSPFKLCKGHEIHNGSGVCVVLYFYFHSYACSLLLEVSN